MLHSWKIFDSVVFASSHDDRQVCTNRAGQSQSQQPQCTVKSVAFKINRRMAIIFIHHETRENYFFRFNYLLLLLHMLHRDSLLVARDPGR